MKVKAKIWAREYVQMEELLHETGDTPMMLSFDLEATLGLTLVPKPFKKTPLSIAQWSLAWNRFVAVLSEQQTNLAPQLAQHMELIMKIAQKRGKWAFYRHEFRKLLARGEASWGSTHLELYLQAMIPDAQNRPATPAPPTYPRHDIVGHRPTPRVPNGACFAFHTTGH